MGLLLFPFGKKATHLITIYLQRGVFIEEARARCQQPGGGALAE